MALYANEHFETFIKDTDLKKAVLLENPVPDNIDPTKKLDYFVRDILKDIRKQRDIDMDNTLEKIQQKTRSVMGPLSKIWMQVDAGKASGQASVCISLDDMKEKLEQTFVLLGQASNSYNIL